jgi:signal transduction histidine kinase
VVLGRQSGFATIAVRDHGIGIADEERDKVFDKFYRVGNSLVHDVKGSGLGLSIVQHIVEAHRGKVSVESELGRGSTFVIHLPVEAVDAVGQTPKSARKNQSNLVGRKIQTDSA